jgi:hypothetical protein
MSMISKVLSAVLAIILTTVVYAEWMHKADKSDRNVVSEKLKTAFDDGVLLTYGYPHYRNYTSRDNLSGLDQGAECFYVQMIMYQEKGNPRSNSLNPGYYSIGNMDFNCAAVPNLLTGTPVQLNDRSGWQIAHKPRLWHGVKALLLTALPSLHYSQITWLIKLTTFCGLGLFAMLVVAANRQVGLAYIPFVLSGYYCSSILFFGGVVYSVPLMAMVLWGVIWLGYRIVFGTKHRAVELFLVTAGGTLHSFFFQMDGAEIYSISLIFFVEIFLSPEGPSRRSLKNAFESCAFYVVGFVGSTLLKNLLVALFAGSLSALYELVQNIAIRAGSVTDTGRKIGLFDIVHGQFHWYGIAAYSIEFIYYFVNASKYIFVFLMVVTVIILSFLHKKGKKKECEQIGIGFFGVVLMMSVVVGRYMVLRQHSDIHIFFVSRYLFVFAGSVYFYGAWLFSKTLGVCRLKQHSLSDLAEKEKNE